MYQGPPGKRRRGGSASSTRGLGTAPRKEAAKVRLRDVLKPGETVVTYAYDFGDDWVHEIRIRDIRQGEPGVGYPRYIAGAHNGPPETALACHASTTCSRAELDPPHEEPDTAVTWLGD